MVKVACASPVLLALALLEPGAASAQEPPSFVQAMIGKQGSASAANISAAARPAAYGPSDLRPEALKKCLTAAHQLDQVVVEVWTQQRRLAAEHEKLKTEEIMLLAERTEIEQTFFLLRIFKSDNSYKTRAKSYQDRSKAYNLEVLALQEKRLSMDRGIDALNKDCSAKQYYAADLTAIEKQLPFDLAKYRAKRK